MPGIPFKKGNPGRPKGSRNKLETDFLDKLYADWKDNGAEAIARVRIDEPGVYLRVIAQVLPKESKVDVEHSGSVDHKHVGLSDTAEWIERTLRGRASGASTEPVSH